MKSIEERIMFLLEKGLVLKIYEIAQILDRSESCIRGVICRMREKNLIDCSVGLSGDNRFKIIRLNSVE